jgi:hypothetical protein
MFFTRIFKLNITPSFVMILTLLIAQIICQSSFAFYEKPVTVLPARKLLIDELTSTRNPSFVKVFTRPNCYFGSKDPYCLFSISDEKKWLETSTRVLALGDSWFAYPTSWSFLTFRHRNENIIIALDSAARARKKQIPASPALYILNYSNNGEHLSNMAGVMPPDLAAIAKPNAHLPGVFHPRKMTLNRAFMDQIARANNMGKPFDVILLSAGGNDFLTDGGFEVDKTKIPNFDPLRFSRILQASLDEASKSHPNQATISDVEAIFKSKIQKYMTDVMLQQQYEPLITSIHKQSPNSKIIIHNYAQIVPRPLGFRFAGVIPTNVGRYGWAWKVMESKHIPLEYRKDFTDIMLDALGSTLLKLEQVLKGTDEDTWFYVLDSKTNIQKHRELVDGLKNSEDKTIDYRIDEIHLNSDGYRIVGESLLDKIIEVVPGAEENLSK